MSTANPMPFAGKWTLASNTGLFITLKDTVTGELDLEASQPQGDKQQLNAYGDPGASFWLQAGNWNYVVFSDTGYFSSQPRTATLAQFQLEPVSGNKYRIAQKTEGSDFYLSANGSKLERIPKAGSPPDTTIFAQQVISPGLAILKFGAMGRNLRGVYFSGDDLTEFIFSGSDLSYAILKDSILKSAVLQGSIVERTDFSGLHLNDVVMTGMRGDSPLLEGVTLYENSDLSGAQIPNANFKGATSTGTTAGTGPVMNTMNADGANFNGATLKGAALSGGSFKNSQWINAKLFDSQAGGNHFDGASMDRLDCKGTALQNNYFDGAQLVSVEFTGADITSCSFKGANLTNAKLSKVLGLTGIKLQGAQLVGTILTGLDLTSVELDSQTVMLAAQMEGVDLRGQNLNGINFVRANMKKAKLDNTSCEGSVMVGTVISFGSATGNVSFVGADLSNSSMEGVDLSGAQFGAKQTLGTLGARAGPDLDQGRLPADLHSLLASRDRETDSAAKITTRRPGQEWIVEDECGEFHLEAVNGAIRVDLVGGVPGAVLSNAYMPNAILTGANLYAVDMSGASWYGTKARADDANLELVNFSNAHLASMNFTQAKMYGANLSFATLVGTDFTGAKLTPTTQLRSSSLSFASLQGAIFTAAQIGGANLTNSAVSLSLEAPVPFVGIPLFALNTSFISSLNKKQISEDLRESFANNGYPFIDMATVTLDHKDVQWTIENYDASSDLLQAGYSNFVLWKRNDNGIEEIAVFGGSPVLTIRLSADNEQEQASIAFGPTKDLQTAMDDSTTTPSGMKLAMQKKGVLYEVLMTGGLPPRPPKCIPTPEKWC